MFGLFKKKSPVDKLRRQYQKLMGEAYVVSKTDRAASDQKYAEADKMMKEIEEIEGKVT